jgi:hypothetical protein
MSTPTGDRSSLRDLERTVETELTQAEGSEAEREALDTPIEEWLFDPADVEREEVALRSLLAAVKTVEGSPAPRPHGNHAAARDHCLSRVRAVDRPIGEARYGRMFPDLAPLGVDRGLLVRAGDVGGICDAAAVLDRPDADGDATEAARWPFFGQLIAHDITADRSPITGGVAAELLHNARAPQLNLEMIYADGPTGVPYMFDIGDPAKFLLTGGGIDVPRNQQGSALIGDPRNDSHRFVLALHVALLHAHNGIVDRLRSAGMSEADVFDTARITLTCLGSSVRTWWRRCSARAAGGSHRRRCRPSSRWSSPTRPSATGTVRSATATDSSPVAPRCGSSPSSSGSAQWPPTAARISRCCSTCPAGQRPSAPSVSTAGSPRA